MVFQDNSESIQLTITVIRKFSIFVVTAFNNAMKYVAIIACFTTKERNFFHIKYSVETSGVLDVCNYFSTTVFYYEVKR